jgi:hypothetical protein
MPFSLRDYGKIKSLRSSSISLQLIEAEPIAFVEPRRTPLLCACLLSR